MVNYLLWQEKQGGESRKRSKRKFPLEAHEYQNNPLGIHVIGAKLDSSSLRKSKPKPVGSSGLSEGAATISRVVCKLQAAEDMVYYVL